MNDFLEYQELYHHGILGQKWGGQNTIKKIGSQEYKDVVERNKKKG